jgi:hypothetical protein
MRGQWNKDFFVRDYAENFVLENVVFTFRSSLCTDFMLNIFLDCLNVITKLK